MPVLAPVARRCTAWTRRAIDRLRHEAKSFRAARSGSVAVVCGGAAIPVFGLVGAAVDYSRANAARTSMQVALDAAALIVAKEAANLTSTQVQNKAKRYFKTEFNQPDVKNLNVAFSMVTNGPGDFTVVAEATGAIDTSI